LVQGQPRALQPSAVLRAPDPCVEGPSPGRQRQSPLTASLPALCCVCRGENGWFKLAMGEGDLGVEQSCDWAVPMPVDF
jgi:hypothetical protein